MRNPPDEPLLSRRLVLRGAGVALTLPWLESLLPTKAAQAQAATAAQALHADLPAQRRLRELEARCRWASAPPGRCRRCSSCSPTLKAKMNVLTNFENGSAFNADGELQRRAEPRPAAGRLAHLRRPRRRSARTLNVAEANAISLDQIMAQHAAFKGKTTLPSLQLGLSTVLSYCDGQPCSNSRSVSWSGADHADVQAGRPAGGLQQDRRRDQAGRQHGRQHRCRTPRRWRASPATRACSTPCSRTPRARKPRWAPATRCACDEFLDSVREVEKSVTGVSMGMGGVACSAIAGSDHGHGHARRAQAEHGDLQQGDHADAMNDLIVMALQCDATRIITLHARGRTLRVHLRSRARCASSRPPARPRATARAPSTTAAVSTARRTPSPASRAGTRARWPSCATKLDAIKEADGTSILDNTVIFFGGAMHGSNHDCNELPDGADRRRRARPEARPARRLSASARCATCTTR